MQLIERFDRLDRLIAEDRVIRNNWVKMNGVEKVCLLAALSPECQAEHNANVCPMDLMPLWMAEITTWIDDTGSDAHWRKEVLVRYPKLIRASPAFKLENWKRLDWMVKRIALRETRRCTHNHEALCLFDVVREYLDACLSGGEASENRRVELWQAARRFQLSMPCDENGAKAYRVSKVAMGAVSLSNQSTISALNGAIDSTTNIGASSVDAADIIITAIFDAWENELKSVAA